MKPTFKFSTMWSDGWLEAPHAVTSGWRQQTISEHVSRESFDPTSGDWSGTTCEVGYTQQMPENYLNIISRLRISVGLYLIGARFVGGWEFNPLLCLSTPKFSLTTGLVQNTVLTPHSDFTTNRVLHVLNLCQKVKWLSPVTNGMSGMKWNDTVQFRRWNGTVQCSDFCKLQFSL